MDWALAIDRNRDALQRIIALLFAMAGLAAGGMAVTLPRHIYRAVLLVLRPAESAVRRLVIIAARGLVMAARSPRAAPLALIPRTGAARTPAFLLIDPLKRFTPDAPVSGPPPRTSVPGLFDPVFLALAPVASAEDLIGAERLCRRLHALKRALDNLPGQARRLARWQARRDLALMSQAPRQPRRLSPFRPGHPPGCRARPIHEIDVILRECHGLALDAYSRLDTS